jgi:IrrE N-terminal-like domain
MTETSPNMKSLYSKLQTIGYNPKYVNSLLPDWWDDEIAETPAGFQQASLILGQTFGIRAETLWTENATPAFNLPEGIRFKHRENIQVDELSVACAVARSLARIVLKAFPDKPRPDFYLDASELRKKLLKDRPWVSFKDILSHCLSIGIPVIHLHHLPAKAKKMDGLAFEQSGRPVIVLTRKNQYGYMLFDLAHELGHISLGHVTAESTVIDQKIDAEADDEDERAANRFALELLTGDPECKIVPAGHNLNANELASVVERFGKKHQIDPMHIALNYGHTQDRFPVANLALKIISNNTQPDQEILNTALIEALDLDELSEDENTFLQIHLKRKAD